MPKTEKIHSLITDGKALTPMFTSLIDNPNNYKAYYRASDTTPIILWLRAVKRVLPKQTTLYADLLYIEKSKENISLYDVEFIIYNLERMI